jgi:hypothetical protein
VEIYFASTQIADDTVLMPGSGWDLPCQVQADVVPLPLATEVQVFARGNRACVITGSVTRQFASHAAAVAFWATHARSLATSGTLDFRVGGVSQATTSAVLQTIFCHRPVGVSVQIDYTFLAPPPTAAA